MYYWLQYCHKDWALHDRPKEQWYHVEMGEEYPSKKQLAFFFYRADHYQYSYDDSEIEEFSDSEVQHFYDSIVEIAYDFQILTEEELPLKVLLEHYNKWAATVDRLQKRKEAFRKLIDMKSQWEKA